MKINNPSNPAYRAEFTRIFLLAIAEGFTTNDARAYSAMVMKGNN